MDGNIVLAALSEEFFDLSRRLSRLQDVPLLQTETGRPLEGEALLNAMVALQDLDRLAQTSAALADFTRQVAGSGALVDREIVSGALATMPMRSVADRLQNALCL